MVVVLMDATATTTAFRAAHDEDDTGTAFLFNKPRFSTIYSDFIY
jgi:hypothetical protein